MKRVTRTISVILFFILFFKSGSIAQTYLNEIINSPKDIMPIELVYFYSQVDDTIVNLYWGTATEVNNYGYDIERADNDLSFNAIGFVLGNGTSNSPKDYYFEDTTITQNGTYHYRLKQIDTDGVSEYSDTVEVIITSMTNVEENLDVNTFKLFQNYPNPFNPMTNITFELPYSSYVQLKVFDCLGNEIATLVNDELHAGVYNYQFSLQDFSKGKRSISISSGVYFYSIIIDNEKKRFIETKKMTIIK